MHSRRFSLDHDRGSELTVLTRTAISLSLVLIAALCSPIGLAAPDAGGPVDQVTGQTADELREDVERLESQIRAQREHLLSLRQRLSRLEQAEAYYESAQAPGELPEASETAPRAEATAPTGMPKIGDRVRTDYPSERLRVVETRRQARDAETSQAQAVELPPQPPEIWGESRRADLVDDMRGDLARYSPGEGAEAAARPASQSSPETIPTNDSAPGSARSAGKPDGRPETDAAAPERFNVVYVAGNAEDVLEMDRRLAEAGVKDRFKVVDNEKGRYRVYVGSFMSQTAAISRQRTVKDLTGLSPQVEQSR
jgi:cell division septation protein DedD